jgi:transaldolase
MELWIEGSIEQVVEVANSGLAGAIATNPSIIERWVADGNSLEYVIEQVCDQVNVPVYVQLRGPTTDDFLREMDRLAAISDKIQPKLVATHAGMAAAKQIAQSGGKPLITTISTVNQAYLAAASGAAYVAPYVGRMLKANVDAFRVVSDIIAMYQRHDVATKVTAASITSPEDAEKLLLAGVPILVMQYSVFCCLLDSSLTQTWIENFEANWKNIPYGTSQS